ncbi:nitrogenase molybdenum-iron protein subunit beta [Sediminispirochaeta smaragdinae]|uniref:Nitrogenase molybdenum-iron protein beta chain n=1 Tax=Sediminispirochaeta smaragdinae (strain DSM 11293 / JCM 15392 / SEBR 4228) TaxID=573413 RepID=E1R3Y5_SEDSS|nr:nitrogenase molybdenum-iron protein subunit beta [Sediminispirochaeta smaragdinae]ADK82106.1 nitrogenase molybdenum-iron protein beta chain [Sediminispirochaeta smaragdinae DSM 11293]
MLLRHTNAEVAERSALTINPSKTCQPIGAMYASLGIHGCLPHSHGSQGCCAYHRSALTRHYKEPVMAGTSSFTEGASVFGGQANLISALITIFNVYNPDVVAVHTTCLSETIGDDVGQIVKKAIDDGKVPEGKRIIHASTPSYVGSHVTGFSSMCASIARSFCKPSEEKINQINLLPGWVDPADMREIKRILRAMKIPSVVFPDTSGVLDAPMTGVHETFPKGGTTVEELESTGKSFHTFALGSFASEAAARELKKIAAVPFDVMDLPIGIRATDRFLMKLSELTGYPVPDSLTDERGRVVDLITDMQQYLAGKKVALFGDPDQLISLTEFLLDMDLKPIHIVSGTPGKKFAKRMESMLDEVLPGAQYRNGARADLFLLHQWIKNERVDLLIGNSYGKYIARDEDIPFMRMGFPIYDRIGHQYFPSIGYAGAMRIAERILDLFMDRQDRDCPEERFELVM